jgi:hypothetical protein
MHEQSIKITSDEIYIGAHLFVKKDYSIVGKELLLDVFSQHYKNQTIRIYAFDGENLEFSGFVEFVRFLKEHFNIPNDKVIWETHATTLKLGIFLSTKKYIPEITNRSLTNAKFVGVSLARFNPTRLRLAYELDRCFPNDNYMIFHSTVDSVKQQLASVSEIYQDELSWMSTKEFNIDIPSRNGSVTWQLACEHYPNIWNKYQIEIISETDTMSDFWFTEKTARCLATGKPFVLVSGHGSLQKLRNMGFYTFSPILDETYDLEIIPTLRINLLLSSLKKVYNNKECLDELYAIAYKNIEAYNNFINS